MEWELLRIRRVEVSAAPAVYVATRLIGALGRTRRVELDRADTDLIVLRVWPASASANGRGADGLLAEVETLLRAGTVAGWEAGPTG